MRTSHWAFLGAVMWAFLGAANYAEIASHTANALSVVLVVAAAVFAPYLLRRGVINTIKENS